MSTALAIPTSGDSKTWTEQEKALVEAAGLVSRGNLAPRPTVEAFLSHCHRTGLDPIARQIYCIERGGRWTTQVSIDGARLVAERSGKYAGQTATQWTADGVAWLDVWLSKEPPAAARVGVYRTGFVEPLYAVATFDQYNPGTSMWKKMPALMLGKCAEMLALRKAFPQDLSGLYSAEEMAQAETPARSPQAAQKPAQAPVEAKPEPERRAPSRDWLADAAAAKSKDELRVVYHAAQEAGDLNIALADGRPLGQYLFELRETLPDHTPEEPAPVEVVIEGEIVDDASGEVSDWPVADIPGGQQ